MKFRNITNQPIVCYGYNFLPGADVDVTEENLIRKFQLYDTLESFIEGDFTEEPEEEEPEELTRDELKKKADELNIEYSPKIRTSTLRELVS